MQAFSLAWRYFLRDWRRADLRVLALALITAVAAVSAVSFFTDRIQRAIVLQAAETLGADLQISANEPLPPLFFEEAQQRGLRTAETLTFPNVLVHQDETTLIAIKAVSAGYPLRGQLHISDTLDGEEKLTDEIPATGEVWLEPKLLTALNLQVGDNIDLGKATFTIGKVLQYEPERSGFLLQLASSVLINQADVAKTQLIGVGSRVRYHVLVAGQTDEIAAYRQWLEAHLQQGQRLRSMEDAHPQLQRALTRAEQFLGLASLITVILAGAAVAVAAHHFSQQQASASAIMRCLGAHQRLILHIYSLRLLSLGLLASSVGCVIGWFVQQGLAQLLVNYFTIPLLPTPSLAPIGVGFATGLITLFGFALPPVLRIHTVPPLRVLRHELGATPLAVWQIFAIASAAILLLMFWQAQDIALAIWMTVGIAVALLLFAGVAYLLMRLPYLLTYQSGITWRFGLANLVRRAQTSILQLTAFGISIMVLLLLSIVRIDLLNTWQGSLTEGTPNYFIINIQPDKVESLRAKLKTVLNQSYPIYPMVRARFIAINEVPVAEDNYTDARAKRFAERTFNLSSTSILPSDNQIVAGRFWKTDEKNQLSLEDGFAKTMGIQLGDSLQFQVGEQKLTATVTSIRTVQWDSFNANFFVLASPDVIEKLPVTYMTSFYLPAYTTQKMFISNLVREFTGITVFDVNVLLRQVRQIIERASLAVQGVFIFTLLAGLMVLYAAISASQEERCYESAILRTLGATRWQVLAGLIAEFATLGLLAGVLAALLASGLGYGLATYLLELPFKFNWIIWLIGAIGGTFGIGLAGVLSTRTVLKQPPLLSLRQ